MDLESLIGETLDGKYKIEKELGRGGMGAVYLSTHLGTERPVAVKVIVPQFMERAEFVERFRREARAAGRLRHPNVVDVTDFGFSDMKDGRVAYLVMEYLDGCTLGEILEEEKRLPLSWTLDILEQVGSAVHEAHEQGIVHRDLKPDNIWLEPNLRGGYTVKVLDFGIAKLETAAGHDQDAEVGRLGLSAARPTQGFSQNSTIADNCQDTTIPDSRDEASEKQTIADTRNSKAFAAEAGTLIQPLAEISSEGGTAILPKFEDAEPDATGTKILTAPETIKLLEDTSNKTSALTRVGAVLGTPLYMSPEQCRGEHLDARSDIYSLAVIAYQMLSGKTPFTGDFKLVMDSHRELPPPALEAKKVPKKVKRTIMSALAKDVEDRPQTAQGFTNELRAQSEGFGVLMQKALIIYSEHLPKFLTMAFLAYLPAGIVSILQVVVSFLTVNDTLSEISSIALKILLFIATVFFGLFCGYLILGTTTWMVTQILAMPLRPLSLRAAVGQVKKKWKSLAFTGSLSTGLTVVGYSLCFFPGAFLAVIWSLVAPVIIMEGLRGKAALRRSRLLVKRSLKTATAAVLTMFLVPFIMATAVSFITFAVVKAFSGNPPAAESKANTDTDTDKKSAPPVIKTEKGKNGFSIDFGDEAEKSGDKNNMGKNLQVAVREGLVQIIMLPMSILISSFFPIVIALLYLKTRQAGGESMQDLLEQFEDADQPHSNWQKQVRQRLIQSGRITGKSATLGRQSKG